MADDIPISDGTAPDLNSLSKAHVDQMFSVGNLTRLETVIGNAIQSAMVNALGAVLSASGSAAAVVVETLAKSEDLAGPAFNRLAAAAISDLFGVDIQIGRGGGGGGKVSGAAARSIGDALVKVFSGQVAPGAGGGELGPSDQPAKDFLTAMAKLALEGWLEGGLVELCSFGQLETFGELDDTISHVLGLGRASAAVHGPLVRHMIVTPLEWKILKEHRPTILNASDILKAFTSGDYTKEEASEELSRLGYSDRRQAVLLKQATKWLSAADSLALARDGQYDRTFAIENLRAQGYDQVGAEQAVLVEELKHLSGIRDDSVAAIRAAYVDRRITDGELDTYLASIFASDEDRSAHVTAMRTVRDLNTKRLSPSEARAAVMGGVLPIAGYREALRLDGYDEESVLVLELLLEVTLNNQADVEKLREQKIAESAAAKRKAADEAIRKAADVAEQRALARRGSLAPLARAVVRGLIPTSRYAEVLVPQYDADTVATMIALVEQDRADFIAQQQKAEDAAKRAAVRHIDVGALQAAYLDNVLTLDQVGSQLTALSFSPADVDVLLATMRARKVDLDAAKLQRAEAAEKAKIKSIDLGRFETLVRRGHRTLAEYGSLLTSLGYDAGSVAAMGELLQLHIADDTAARDARAADAAKRATAGLSLDQIRRAVIRGVTSVDAFQTYLVQNKYTVDAQTVLLAELRDAVTEAEAARAKRAAAAGATVETRVPLATVARAARLGIIAPDVYEQRLVDAGYTDDDVAIELDLLAVEIADVQAARARAAAAEAATADRGLSLDQVAKAVKLGVATIGDYQTRAIELGYGADDVDTLVAVLEEDVQAVRDAEARHTTVDTQLKARNLSLSELDAAVKAGQMTIDGYHARLVTLGYGADDADLLTTLLVLKLPAAPDEGRLP